jgi:hypothetical protein
MSCIVAHNLSGLEWSLLEVTDETGRVEFLGNFQEKLQKIAWSLGVVEDDGCCILPGWRNGLKIQRYLQRPWDLLHGLFL